MNNTIPEIHRLLPSAPDAEKAVISAFSLAPEFAGSIYDEKGITRGHFHIPANEIIFGAMKGLYEERKPMTFLAITQVIRDRGLIDQVGGAAYVAEVLGYFPTAINAAYDADIVASKHTLREIIRVCLNFGGMAYEPQEDSKSLLDGLESAVLAIRKGDDSELREIDPREGAMAAIHELERLYESKGEITGLSTGFYDMDRMTDGLHPGEMTVIAGRPSMGKTAFAMNIAEHISLNLGKPTAVFSAEMAGKKLHERLICSVARINAQRARDGYMTDSDFPRLTAAAGKIAGSKLFVVDAIGATVSSIRAKARRMHRKHGLAAIFIDYLQYLRSRSAQAQKSREREISEISQGLKSLAKELDLPVVVLAQLNRNADNRKGDEKGRPMLSDLRESGSIEQDADTVGLLMRAEYYATNDEERKEKEGQATLIIAKQRNGPVGDVPLTFLKEFTRFETRARETKEEPRTYVD